MELFCLGLCIYLAIGIIIIPTKYKEHISYIEDESTTGEIGCGLLFLIAIWPIAIFLKDKINI